jgi:7-cyano-7-deazaguanine synthase in queuosine biosynthesis
MELYLNPDWKRIGISLSGGADSALLAYLICKNVSSTTEIHINTQIRLWKTRPWAEHVADNVVAWFKDNFDHKFYVHKNLVPPELEEPTEYLIKDEYGKMKPGNRIILRSHNEYIAHKHNLDALYAGVNMNPDVDFPGKVAERDHGHIAPHFVHNGVDICHPFVYTKKNWIIRQYYNNNIESLLNVTRSCEGEFEGLDYTTYKPGMVVPLCGDCFWCKERQWGIDNA